MSTKIYEGYRFPVGRLVDFVDLVRAAGIRAAAAKFRVIIKLDPTEDALAPVRASFLPCAHPDERRVLFRRVLWWAGEASVGVQWDPCDCDVSWNVWPSDDGHCYAVPYGGAWHARWLRPLPAYVHDYRYWNNTDQPQNISRAEWEQRGRDWDGAFDDGHDARRLQFVVVSCDPRHVVGVPAICARILGPGMFFDAYSNDPALSAQLCGRGVKAPDSSGVEVV